MARSFGLKAKLQFTYILDVGAAVGKNSPNHRDDVLLVQYLLAVWLAHEKDLAKLTPLLAKTPLLTVDGICGNNTNGVIRTFEEFHQPQVNSDGRIDPAFSSIQSRKMFLLNQILFFAGGLRGGVPETRIPFPREIVPLLYR